MKFYLHLIDGRPAYFSKRDGQIVYMENSATWQDEIGEQALCSSRKEIIEHEATTRKNRRKWGMEATSGQYGYAIVTLPSTPAQSEKGVRTKATAR